jgi:hypothetical protein
MNLPFGGSKKLGALDGPNAWHTKRSGPQNASRFFKFFPSDTSYRRINH